MIGHTAAVDWFGLFVFGLSAAFIGALTASLVWLATIRDDQ